MTVYSSNPARGLRGVVGLPPYVSLPSQDASHGSELETPPHDGHTIVGSQSQFCGCGQLVSRDMNTNGFSSVLALRPALTSCTATTPRLDVRSLPWCLFHVVVEDEVCLSPHGIHPLGFSMHPTKKHPSHQRTSNRNKLDVLTFYLDLVQYAPNETIHFVTIWITLEPPD